MIFAILAVLVITIAYKIYSWHHEKVNYFKKRGFPFRKPKLPLGNMQGIGSTRHITDIVKDLYEEFKDKAPVFGMYLFTGPSFVVSDLEVVKDVLIKNFSNFQNRGV